MYDPFLEYERRIQNLERRIENMVRVAKVTEVDAAKGLVKFQDGDFLSEWQPWVQRAGTIKDWQPPSVGEQVLAISPSGQPEQAWVQPGGFSDANPQPHNVEAEHVLTTIGSMRIQATGTEVTITVGGTVITAKDGEATIKADKIVLDGTVYLGGPDADKAAGMLGSLDTAAQALVSALATKVFVK
jgi:phage baseplate assembly protein V